MVTLSLQTPTPPALIRRKLVEARTGLARSTIYERLKSGDFPKPVALGSRSVGWVESEIDEWIAARIAASRKGVA